MTTLKQGDLIKDRFGNTYKIMEVCGIILHISFSSDHDKYGHTTAETNLKAGGYTWDTPAWEPKDDETYWFITPSGQVCECEWINCSFDQALRDFLGIYQTEALAEAALLEIRRKLGK